jgi:aryl-phospho-beta-D-glucosidase BglC (GH1 family)
LGGIVANIWNAGLTTNGNHRTVQNAAWNGGIGAGGSVSFGFTGSYSGSRPSPSNCNINGGACTFEGVTPGGTTPPPPPPPPLTISIASPLPNTTVSGTVSIVAQTGGNGIVSVQFFVDGSNIGQDTGSPYSVSWTTTTVNNGAHSLTAKVNTSSQSVTSNPVPVNVQQPALPPPPPPPTGVEGFLSLAGSQLVDSDGNPVRLTGVNWFGFETHNRVVHGLWNRDYRSMLHQIHDLGFNVLRLPWSNGIFDAGAQSTSITFSGADPYDGRSPMNQPLAGKTPIQILDLVIEEAGRLGLKVFLDNHSRKPDGFASEDLWYTQDFSEQQWISHWVIMADRYKNNPTVIGFDLDNEPHGRSTWGTNETASDWAAAAERCAAAIQAVHPDALIIVEGIESYNGANYWWGGNLRGVRTRPLNINPAKLIYSPHDYSPEVYAQPWFFDPSYPNNLTTVWDEAWGFIRRENRGYLLLGEFGIQSQTSHSGKSLLWIQRLMAYTGSTMSWTFWTINPNSGDTGGILQDNWVSVNQWKMDILSPYLAPQFPAP